MTFTHALSTNNYGPAKFIVSSSAANGTHTTVQSAITASSSGDVVFIRAGTYTENITHKAGVHVTSFQGVGDAHTVAIVGKWTISGAGTFSISGIELRTNSDFVIDAGGSAGNVIELDNIYINATNNDAISFTNSTASVIQIYNSFTAIASTFKLYNMTSPGFINFFESEVEGPTSTSSTNSAGQVGFANCQVSIPFSTSSTGSLAFANTRLDTEGLNVTAITMAGTGTGIFNHGDIYCGSASCVSIGAGVSMLMTFTNLGSTNTNVLTGAGTLNYAFISFSESSSGHNVTTETALPTLI